jgi:LmbE family N-acetylglucosaminyl deacetylase
MEFIDRHAVVKGYSMGKYGIFGAAALSGALVGRTAGIGGPQEAEAARADVGDIVIEKDAPGRPHAGKVFAAIHAHLDDIPFYCAGTCAKLIAEGYTGYIIRTTNDERCGPGSFLQNIKSNEEEHVKMAKALGCTDVFDFYYRNHDMDAMSSIELRYRLIFLFRMLKVDTVITFNPWGHGEENPDHWMTGRGVEESRWMAGMGNDYPELSEAGLKPHSVTELYFFVGRPGQPYNRVVDISSHIEKKIDSTAECRSQGGGNSGSLLRARLAKEGKRLPILGNDDRTADREYIRHFLLGDEERNGKSHGVKYAELFYYIDQRSPAGKSKVEEYIEKNAMKI